MGGKKVEYKFEIMNTTNLTNGHSEIKKSDQASKHSHLVVLFNIKKN